VSQLIGLKTDRKTDRKPRRAVQDVIRVNFRTKKIRTPERERRFNTIFKYYRGEIRIEDFQYLHGPECFDEKELQFYINTIDPTILSSEETILYQKVSRHILVCDLCLLKAVKIDD